MTRDDLLALVGTTFSHRLQPVTGGLLFCHTPHVGRFAYLGSIYDPVSEDCVGAWATRAQLPRSPYFSFVTAVANGVRIANLSLYGIIGQVDRSIGQGVGQPISLDYGNVVERPTNLADTDTVIGGMVGWSSRGALVMGRDGAVRLVHCSNGADVAEEWLSLSDMLRQELRRIADLHDLLGRRITTATDLMHPKGRRWETEVETGSVRH